MKLKVNAQSLEIEGGGVIAEGAVEFASFTLECDKSWDGFSKTVRFRHVSQEESFDVAGVEQESVYYIPSEVLIRGGVFVSVLGVKGDVKISTTELAGFFVEGTIDSGRVPTVTPNAYAQYVNIVTTKVSEAEKSSKDAEGYCIESLESVRQSRQALESCLAHEESCRTFAELCRRVSLEVEDADTSMNYMLNSVKDAADALIGKGSELSQSESVRVASENARTTAESERESAELHRARDEENRALSEAERVANERARILSDSIREKRLGALEQGVIELSDLSYKKAEAIVGKQEGKKLLADDVENTTPLKFELIGEGTQASVPSISSPSSIEGTEGSTITHTGKNLLKCVYDVGRVFSVSGIDYTILENGKIKVEGATQDSKSSFEFSGDLLNLEAGSYLISGGYGDCGIFAYNMDDKEYIAYSYGADAEFTLKKRANIRIRVYIYANKNIGTAILSPMLRYKGTEGSFEVYKQKSESVSFLSPLYSVSGVSGNISDKAVFCEYSDLPHISRNLKKRTLSGIEQVELLLQTSEFNTFEISLPEEESARIFPEGKYANMGFCTHLPYADELDGECCFAMGDKIYVKLNSTDFPDTSSLLAFLSRAYTDEIPFAVVYALENPVTEPYDREEKIELFKTGEVATTSGTIRLEYIRSINTMIEKIIDTLVSLDARISLLEV